MQKKKETYFYSDYKSFDRLRTVVFQQRCYWCCWDIHLIKRIIYLNKPFFNNCQLAYSSPQKSIFFSWKTNNFKQFPYPDPKRP